MPETILFGGVTKGQQAHSDAKYHLPHSSRSVGDHEFITKSFTVAMSHEFIHTVFYCCHEVVTHLCSPYIHSLARVPQRCQPEFNYVFFCHWSWTVNSATWGSRKGWGRSVKEQREILTALLRRCAWHKLIEDVEGSLSLSLSHSTRLFQQV